MIINHNLSKLKISNYGKFIRYIVIQNHNKKIIYNIIINSFKYKLQTKNKTELNRSLIIKLYFFDIFFFFRKIIESNLKLFIKANYLYETVSYQYFLSNFA